MATIRTVTVKSTGGDYVSLAAAIAGESKDLVSLDRQLIIECYAMTDTAAVEVNNTVWTTDATRNIIITSPVGERHSGKWDSSKYNLVPLSANPMRIGQGVFITVEWLQIGTAGTLEVLSIGLGTNSASDITIRNNIIRGVSSGGNVGALYMSWTGNAATNLYIYNNLVYNATNGSGSAIRLVASGNVYLANNTVADSYNGVYKNSAPTVYAENNLVSVTTGYAFNGTYAAGTNYNITNSTVMAISGSYTVTGSGNTHDMWNRNLDFVDATNKDFRIGRLAVDARMSAIPNPITSTPGNNGYFTDDVTGATRLGTLWDRGAFEYQGTPLDFPSSPTVGQIHIATPYRWQWDGANWNYYSWEFGKGLTGAQGFVGATGFGPAGATGASGGTGPSYDFLGSTGVTGSVGFRGATGPNTSIGNIGRDGATGATGIPAIGATGFDGATASAGGAIGATGFIGASGAMSVRVGASGATSFSNTSTIQTYYTYTIPQNGAPAGTLFRFRCGGRYVQNSASTNNLQLTVSIGASVFFVDVSGTITDYADYGAWHLDFDLACVSTTSQVLVGNLNFQTPGAKNNATTGIGDLSVVTHIRTPIRGTATVDTTAGSTAISVKWKMNTTSTADIVECDYGYVLKIA